MRNHVFIWPERDVPILLATGQAEPSGIEGTDRTNACSQPQPSMTFPTIDDLGMGPKY